MSKMVTKPKFEHTASLFAIASAGAIVFFFSLVIGLLIYLTGLENYFPIKPLIIIGFVIFVLYLPVGLIILIVGFTKKK